MKNILNTGGAGFIGSHVVRLFLNKYPALEKRTGLKIACLEEIGLKMKWLNKVDISKDLEGKKGEYYSYLASIVN